jgi:hypothetical protein
MVSGPDRLDGQHGPPAIHYEYFPDAKKSLPLMQGCSLVMFVHGRVLISISARNPGRNSFRQAKKEDAHNETALSHAFNRRFSVPFWQAVWRLVSDPASFSAMMLEEWNKHSLLDARFQGMAILIGYNF